MSLEATWPQTWHAQVELRGNTPAFRKKRRGVWDTLTWADWYARSMRLAMGLADLGLRRDDGVLVICGNRFEWPIIDVAVQSVGASIFGMNTSASMADVRAELEANEVRFVIVEDPRFASLLSKIDDERERHVLVIESMKGVQCGWGKVSQLSDVEVRGAQCLALSSADAFLRMIRSGSPLSVVGTEPDPASESRQLKVLQSAFVARLQTDTSRAQRTVSFVSQAGLAERVFQLRTVLSGGVSHFPEDSETIANDLQEVMPDRIEAPIRFWRERQGEILNAVADAPWLSRRIFAWASASTRPGSLRRMALYNVRHRMGLLRARSVIPSGTQELNLLCDWYRSIGVHVEAPAKERLGKSSESPVGKAIREETCLVGISPRCESGPST